MRTWLAAVAIAVGGCTPGVPTLDHGASSQAPSPRTDASSAYDAANGTIVLFGGADRSGVLGDTWTWDGTGWVLKHPATSPPAREFAYMGFDPATSRVVLFGGTTCAPPGPSDVTGCDYQRVQTNLNDTWSWDGSNWTKLDTAHTPAIQAFRGDFGGIAADESHHDLILVTWPTGSDRSTVETWTLQDADWHELQPAHPPAPYEFSGPTYDAVTGHLILQQRAERFGATYWWDGTDWRFFDPSVNTPHSYGGLVSAGDHGLLLIWSDNVYSWNGRSWSSVTVLPDIVSSLAQPRDGWTASFDERTRELILFGGRAGAGGPDLLGDTVGWDGSAWKTLVSAKQTPLGVLGQCSPKETAAGLGGRPNVDPTGEIVEVDFTEPPSGPCHLDVAVVMTVYVGNDVVAMTGNPKTQQVIADLKPGVKGIAVDFDVHNVCAVGPGATAQLQAGDLQTQWDLSIHNGCGTGSTGPPSITSSVGTAR